MQRLIVCTLTVLLTSATFSQEINRSTLLSKEDYLKKSKRQKADAWALLAGGTILIGAAFLTQDESEASLDHVVSGNSVLGALGGLSTIVSITLFIVASNNKKRAMAGSLHVEASPLIARGKNFTHRSFPMVSLKITL